MQLPSRKSRSKFPVRRKPWRVRLVASDTGNPIPGIKLRIQSISETDHKKKQSYEVTSDAQGLVQVDIAEGESAEVEVISTDWWQASGIRFVDGLNVGSLDVGNLKSEPRRIVESAWSVELQPLEIKLNRGQPIDIPKERTIIR